MVSTWSLESKLTRESACRQAHLQKAAFDGAGTAKCGASVSTHSLGCCSSFYSFLREQSTTVTVCKANANTQSESHCPAQLQGSSKSQVPAGLIYLLISCASLWPPPALARSLQPPQLLPVAPPAPGHPPERGTVQLLCLQCSLPNTFRYETWV